MNYHRIKSYFIKVSHCDELCMDAKALSTAQRSKKKKVSPTKWRVVFTPPNGKKFSTDLVEDANGCPFFNTKLQIHLSSQYIGEQASTRLLVQDSQETHIGQAMVTVDHLLANLDENGIPTNNSQCRKSDLIVSELQATKRNSSPNGRIYFWCWIHEMDDISSGGGGSKLDLETSSISNWSLSTSLRNSLLSLTPGSNRSSLPSRKDRSSTQLLFSPARKASSRDVQTMVVSQTTRGQRLSATSTVRTDTFSDSSSSHSLIGPISDEVKDSSGQQLAAGTDPEACSDISFRGGLRHSFSAVGAPATPTPSQNNGNEIVIDPCRGSALGGYSLRIIQTAGADLAASGGGGSLSRKFLQTSAAGSSGQQPGPLVAVGRGDRLLAVHLGQDLRVAGDDLDVLAGGYCVVVRNVPPAGHLFMQTGAAIDSDREGQLRSRQVQVSIETQQRGLLLLSRCWFTFELEPGCRDDPSQQKFSSSVESENPLHSARAAAKEVSNGELEKLKLQIEEQNQEINQLKLVLCQKEIALESLSQDLFSLRNRLLIDGQVQYLERV